MTASGRRRTIGIVVVLLLLSPLLVDWLITTEEERVQAVVDVALEAIERRDADQMAGLLSVDFEDETGVLPGKLAREGVAIAIEATMERIEPELDVDRRDVEVDGDRATLDFEAVVVAEVPWAGRRLPVRVMLQAELGLEDDGEWRFLRLRQIEFARGL